MKIIPRIVTLKNGLQITLRSATPEDAQMLLDHLRISHAESYQNLNSSGAYWEGVPLEEEKKLLAHFEQAPNKFMLVAETGAKLMAGLGLFGAEREFTKKNASLGISIQESFCGEGLGSAMMEYALEQARLGGIHRIDLSVRTYNEAGIKLYEKFGFRRVGLLKDAAFIDGKYVDEYYYELIL